MKIKYIILFFLLPFYSGYTQIYVSPHGDNQNDGNIENPLATLQEAIQKISTESGNDDKSGGTIFLRQGTYQVKETIKIHESNTNISIQSFENEKVVFSGGVSIPLDLLQKEASDQKTTKYKLDLKSAGITDYGIIRNVGFARPYGLSWGELFVNRKPMHLSRWPNNEMIPMGKVLDKGSVPRNDDFANKGGVMEYDSMRIDKWANEKDAWMAGYFMWGYADDMVKISSIDTQRKTLTAASATLYGYGYDKPWRNWYGVNILSELDEAGEYYINRENGMLYFITSEKQIESLEFSLLEDPFLSLSKVSNISIRGITFECSRGLGIAMDNTQGITIKECTFRNLGSLGITVGKGIEAFDDYRHEGSGVSQSGIVGSLQQHLYANTTFNREGGNNNKIIACQFYDLGAGGISLGGGNRLTLEAGKNIVENCMFHDVNRIEKSYRPAVDLTGVGNKVRHCEMYNSPSMAIYMHGNNHLIEFNYIHDVCLEVEDQGAFYYGRDPSERGTIIRNNYFENIPGHFNTSAVYSDDGACGLTVFGNVFYKAGKRNVLLGGGSDNLYKNNIFIDTKIGIHVDNRLQNWSKGLLDQGGLYEKRLKAVNYQSPPYSTQYPELTSYFDNPALPKRNLVENNVFVEVGQLLDGKKEWLDLKENNWETDREIDFVDWEKLDFSLKRKSAVFKEIPRFGDIPFSKIGLYEAKDIPFFPGTYPGQPDAVVKEGRILLYNDAILAQWNFQQNTITLQKVTNKYDGETVDLSDAVLFSIQLENGEQLTNHDFLIQNIPIISDIAATDSLPTQALQFAGKEISALMKEKDGNIAISWKAQLRDGSNYIRQNIEIKSTIESVKISKVTFFDGSLDGAEVAGLVLGSPIEYNNFFFGLEHPIAHSKALMTRRIGSVTQAAMDVSDLIDVPGKYTVSVEHGGGSADYNIESVALLENEQQISIDKHPLNGAGGSNFYQLDVENIDVTKDYKIQANVSNISNATGIFHIHRKTNNILNFYVERVDELQPGQSISEWSVVGVSPPNQNRRAFLYYLERERARPYKQFLHYNCWWDITDDGASSFTSAQLIERMHAWNEKFIQPYGVELNSFVFDDGWDDLDSVWYFDPVKFPEGFTPQAKLCEAYNSGIGVWMSPFGGYSENKRRRIESAHREGLETNDAGLSLTGDNYYNRFLDRSLDMLNNYKVNYFKYDGFGGSEPKYLSDMEAGARLINTLRQHNPDVYINITVGSWPSPFWLKYADCTWRGSGDLHMAGKGTRTQKFMTYRDGTLHNNIVKKAPHYPLNSIMTVGIAYANLGHPIKCINDSIADFQDMVWSFFGAGSSLQELYISHDRMKPEFWPILADAAKWSKENEDILKDTHWIGGSPINLEVYGFASWSPDKSIITLRNPGENQVDYMLNLNHALELPDTRVGEYVIKSPRIGDADQEIKITASRTDFLIPLQPFETKILELVPTDE